MERLLCVVIGYLFGLIQTGYIYGKIKNIENEEEQEICHQLNRRTEFRVLRTTYKLYE